MRIEHEIEIEAPVATVWALTLDVESWPQMSPTMDSVERLDEGPIAVGSQARIKQPGQGVKVWTVTQLDHEKTFAWSTRSLGMTMTGIHRLRSVDQTTVNTLVVDIAGGPAPVVGRLLRRPILEAITAENEGFKKAAEEAEGS
ncbi:MAG: SRPBCC family protein [Acidimicrobiia bacterium]|nr:SRPBCC family protein [Acidimicrobiia bacterium]